MMTMPDVEVALFPPLPKVRGNWRPMYLEPIFSSGERLTIAIVLAVENRAIIKSVIRPDVLKWLYGSKAPNIRGLVELCVDSLYGHIGKKRTVESWRSPITGIFLGPVREAAANSPEGILEQAIHFSASLSAVDQATLDSTLDGDDDQQASGQLVERIRDIVFQRKVDLIPYFNQATKFFENGETIKFGFLGMGVVAQFGTIRSRSLSRNIKDVRGRLWELAKARSKIDSLRRAGLILWVPPSIDDDVADKHSSTLERAANELRLEAQEAGIDLKEVKNADDGATELVQLVA